MDFDKVKAEMMLKKILQTKEGNEMAQQMKNMSPEAMKRQLLSLDKDEMVRKLNAMNLSSVADKVKSSDKSELIEKLNQTPEVLSKINEFLKNR